MREFKKVVTPEEANQVVVISDAWGRNLVRRKVYFFVPSDVGKQACLRYVCDHYPDEIGDDIRIDMYRVRNGRTIGRC